MTDTRHGKIPKWYDKDSEHYDTFNEDAVNSSITNNTIYEILQKCHVKTVLDLTCGTGSQVFWLAKRGYIVTGSDISLGMLGVAKYKATCENIDIKLLHGDMRNIKVGKFDVAITIFNAIGHLTKFGFEKTMRNIYDNLNDEGIYIFDIFNLNYLMYADNISNLTIDWIKTVGDDAKSRKIQYSIIDNRGVLASHTIEYDQDNSGKLKTVKTLQTLQCYTAKQIIEMLYKNGFEVLGQYGIDGSKFSEIETERILTVAKKKVHY